MLNARKRLPLQRLSLAWIATSLKGLDVVSDLSAGDRGVDAWGPLVTVKTQIDQIYSSSIYSQHLRISATRVHELTGLLEALVKELLGDDNRGLNQYQIEGVKSRLAAFQTVILAELESLPVFLITPKESFDLNRLIDNGLSLYPPSLSAKVPESVPDASESGKCLAFERNTACGFHAFRAVEAVTRRYWDAVSNGKSRPVPETLGTMAAQMEICKFGDTKVHESLKQMTKLHRNPIAHPDVFLDSDEAIAILGMARSVMTPMLSVLPDAPLTTSSASAAQFS